MDEWAFKRSITLLMAMGLIDKEQAAEVDRLAGELATRICNGELTEEQAGALAQELALKHAAQTRARRQT
jgi:DNA primase large subunit